MVRLQNEYDVELDWKPFELHPDTPPGGIAITDYFPEPRFSMMRRHLRQYSASMGLEPLDPAPRLSNTRRLLTVAEYARDQGKLTEYRHAALHVYWREQKGVES